jgi:hypothetical protein
MRRSLGQARLILAVAGLLAAAPAFGQSSFPDPQGTQAVPGTVTMCLSAQGKAVPCSFSDLLPQPDVVPAFTAPGADKKALAVTISPNSGAAGQYPSNAIPITGNATGTTGAVVGTLTADPGRKTWICGFNVSAIGGTAAVGPVTIAGLTGSSMVYQLASSAGGAFLTQTFTPCIPASALNTAITITTTADGTATAVSVNSWGFRQ